MTQEAANAILQDYAEHMALSAEQTEPCEDAKVRKIYQVCWEYYDAPDSEILKTFSSKAKAEAYRDAYKQSKEWKDNGRGSACIVINEHEVE